MSMLFAVVTIALVTAALAACGERTSSERFLAHRVLADDRTLRVVYGASSSQPPREIELRLDDNEIGVTVYREDPETYLMDLRLHCAEAALPEPVGGRRIVDDSDAEFNPYGGSLDAARKVAAGRLDTCERVPAE